MHRLFVALKFPEIVNSELAMLCSPIEGARWTGINQHHMTLCFIGEVDKKTLNKVNDTLQEIPANSFELTLKGIDYFGSKKEPRLLWVGVDECPELVELQSNIEDALLDLGIKRDEKKFHPHVTLARLNHSPYQHVGNFIQQFSLYRSSPIIVESFHLYSSIKGVGAATYHLESTFDI